MESDKRGGVVVGPTPYPINIFHHMEGVEREVIVAATPYPVSFSEGRGHSSLSPTKSMLSVQSNAFSNSWGHGHVPSIFHKYAIV